MTELNSYKLKPFWFRMEWVKLAGLHAAALTRFTKWSSFHLFFRDESTDLMMLSSW